MTADRRFDSRASLRRWLGWSLVAGLSIAALTAAIAVVDGSFDETDGRVIGTSLGFAIFSAIGATGMSLRLRRPAQALQLLGGATALAAIAAFLLLVAAIWIDNDHDALWQWWGAAALLSLGTSHASLVLGARAVSDAPIVDALTHVSLITGAIDTSIAILLVAEAIHDGPSEVFALLVIALVLSTVLTPLLRRLTGSRVAAATPTSPRPPDVAAELLEIAARVELLAQATGTRTGELRRHADALRASAKQL
ncbi:MAG TPA: hypothetical protein VHF90_07155 [Thermoleophilaceae bacterium]|nr:hypothetical protein [Thermoleophilaceae bacterium]